MTLSSHVGENYETVRNWLVTQEDSISITLVLLMTMATLCHRVPIISQDPASGEVTALKNLHQWDFCRSQGTEPKLNDISGYAKKRSTKFIG